MVNILNFKTLYFLLLMVIAFGIEAIGISDLWCMYEDTTDDQQWSAKRLEAFIENKSPGPSSNSPRDPIVVNDVATNPTKPSDDNQKTLSMDDLASFFIHQRCEDKAAVKPILGHPNIECITAAARCVLIAIEQYNRNKSGENSKKSLISSLATDVARLFNDSTSIYNEYMARNQFWVNGISTLPMVFDFSTAYLKIKKLYAQNYSNKEEAIKNEKISKLMTKLRQTTPFIEMAAVGFRSMIKCARGQCDDKKLDRYIQACTTALILIRAVDILAQGKLNNSTRYQIFALGTIALVLSAVVIENLNNKKPRREEKVETGKELVCKTLDSQPAQHPN